MLLSVWRGHDAAWHARLVDDEARLRAFDNPLELARYLAGIETARSTPALTSGLR